MDDSIIEEIQNFNQKSFNIYKNYLFNLVNSKNFDNSKLYKLPNQEIYFNNNSKPIFDKNKSILETIHSNNFNISIRNPFIALNGHDDDINDGKELFDTIRNDIYIEESLIPIYKFEFLNNYIHKFLCEERSFTEIRDNNKYNDQELWEIFENWKLILKTIKNVVNEYCFDENINYFFNHIFNRFNELFRF
jgi:hypothetical protein